MVFGDITGKINKQSRRTEYVIRRFINFALVKKEGF